MNPWHVPTLGCLAAQTAPALQQLLCMYLILEGDSGDTTTGPPFPFSAAVISLLKAQQKIAVF